MDILFHPILGYETDLCMNIISSLKLACKNISKIFHYSTSGKQGGRKQGGRPDWCSQYRRLVGKLIYFSHRRPGIAFAVRLASQFMHSPNRELLEATYRILRYLKSSPRKGLLFKKGGQQTIEAYIDAYRAGTMTDGKSTSGYCTYVWGNLTPWRSKKQNVVAWSNADAKFQAMANRVF